jgi:hypothetical protein
MFVHLHLPILLILQRFITSILLVFARAEMNKKSGFLKFFEGNALVMLDGLAAGVGKSQKHMNCSMELDYRHKTGQRLISSSREVN